MGRIARNSVFWFVFALVSPVSWAAEPTPAPENFRQIQDEKPFYKCWQYSLDAPLASAPITDNGTVFLPESDGKLRALDSENGSVKWSVELGGTLVSNLVIEKSEIYVVTSPVPDKGKSPSTSFIRIINSDSGITKKSIELPYSDWFYIFETGKNLLTIDRVGTINSLDPRSGKHLWRRTLGSEVTVPPSISDAFVSIALENGKVLVIEIESGSVVLDWNLEHRVKSIALYKAGRIVMGDDRGNVFGYRFGGTAPEWRYKIGGAVASISAGRDDALVTSFDNFLYSMDPASGSVNWRKRLSGRAIYAPLWSEGKVFTPTIGESTVMVFDLSSGKTVNRIELGENMYPLQVPSVTGTGNIIFSIPGSIVAFGAQSCSK